ncbi:PAS domain S-box protein [Deinococcus misasensis]|uniref:PAS domain S-box protein n=1 Tax=Deinococcus misasensis TaxID=392413 RepID=UPI00068FBDB8|nr:PAS domain S-box protein [Deinococcus misasensis]
MPFEANQNIRKTLRWILMLVSVVITLAFTPVLVMLVHDALQRKNQQWNQWHWETRTFTETLDKRLNQLVQDMKSRAAVQDARLTLFGRCEVAFTPENLLERWGYQSATSTLECLQNGDSRLIPAFKKPPADKTPFTIIQTDRDPVLMLWIPVRHGFLWAMLSPKGLEDQLPDSPFGGSDVSVALWQGKLAVPVHGSLLPEGQTTGPSHQLQNQGLKLASGIQPAAVNQMNHDLQQRLLRRVGTWSLVLMCVILILRLIRDRAVGRPLQQLMYATAQTTHTQMLGKHILWPNRGLFADLSRAMQSMALAMQEGATHARQQEKRYHDMINLAQDGVIVIDASNTIVLANPAAHQMFGHPEGSMLGQSGNIIMPERFREEHQKGLERVVTGGASRLLGSRGEVVGLRSDGTEFPIELSQGAIRQPEGMVFSSLLRDITAQKRNAEERKMIYELTQRLGSISDPSLALQAVMESLCKMYGWVFSEVWKLEEDGKLRLKTHYTPEPAKHQRFIQQAQHMAFALGEGLPGKTLQTGEPEWLPDVTQAQHFLRSASAAEHGLAAALAVPVQTEHRKLVVVWYHPDPKPLDQQTLRLTQTVLVQLRSVLNRIHSNNVRLQAEERYRQAVDQAPYPMVTVSREGHIQRWNREFSQMMGNLNFTELNWLDLMEVPSEMEAMRHAIGRVFEGEFVQDQQVTALDFQGNKHHFLATLYPLQNDEGRVELCMITGVDVTERLLMEQEREQRRAAETASQAKTAFLSRMSHELRTPLNAVIGFSELLLFEPMDPEQKNDVQEIHKAGKHLLSLVNDLLDLSSIEAGKVQVHHEPISLHHLLQDISPMLFNLTGQYGRNLFLPEGSKPLTALGDAQRLKQVILNLVSNAAKYGRNEIRVEMHASEEEVQLTVSDDGEGLTHAQQKKLFVPFERLEQHEKVEGTGLGLVISHQYMTLMGGDLTVQSTANQGSTFTVHLQRSTD